MLPDIELARQTQLLPIAEVASRLGIGPEHLEYYGSVKAKIAQEFCQSLENAPASGKLILVSGINPTPAGEGKTTTTIGLGDALNRIGKRATICLREPSLGPCFGMKGGATGGGYAQVAPMEGTLRGISTRLPRPTICSPLHWTTTSTTATHAALIPTAWSGTASWT